MQRLEVSCAVRHIYIYIHIHIVRRQSVKTYFVGLSLDVLDGYTGLETGPLAQFCNDGNEPWFPQKARNFLTF